MSSKSKGKQFLDSSVLRLLFHGTREYKKYLSSQLAGGDTYISKFVQMEFRRSFLRSLMNFIETLDMPHIETIDDALKL